MTNRCTVMLLTVLLSMVSLGAEETVLQIGKDKQWNEPRPGLPDLSVQYISRLPRFPGLEPKYVDIDDPVHGQGPTGPVTILNPDNPGWPAPGQEVRWIAVVRNVGARSVGPFEWFWLYDGRDVAGGRTADPLAPDESVSFTLRRPWEKGEHTIAFQVDRERAVEEISEENNWVIDRTDALSFAFFVEESVVDFFRTVRSGLGSYDFADWAQFQVRQINKEFRDTIYPSCPEGIIERVRLDRVYRIPDGWGAKGGMHTPNVVVPVNCDDPELVSANDPPKDRKSENFNNVIGGVDGVWGFTVDLLQKKKEWGGGNFYQHSPRWLTGSEWPLHHELGHQLGRVDNYLIPTAADANEAIPGLFYNPPEDYRNGMMFSGNYAHDDAIGKNRKKWDSTYRFYSEQTAASLNRDKGVRRGLFGEYLFDVPSTNTFVILDAERRPIPGAKVELFVAKGRGYTNPGFGAEPNFTATTDDRGTWTLDRNPWDHVFIWASNGVLMFRVTPADGGGPLAGFLDISHCNLAYWRGHRDHAEYRIVVRPVSELLEKKK